MNVIDFIAKWEGFISLPADFFILYMHFSGQMRSTKIGRLTMALVFFIVVVNYFNLHMMLGKQGSNYTTVMLMLFDFAVLLFVIISEMMEADWAARLTARRGENWVKEIDYFYLLLGAAGLAISTSRIETFSGRVYFPDTLGPTLLMVAIVFRLIKTRAEINGWNKRRTSAPGSV